MIHLAAVKFGKVLNEALVLQCCNCVFIFRNDPACLSIRHDGFIDWLFFSELTVAGIRVLDKLF
ncbi:Uncharacterised protein [Mycobacteroides abscessus subsp. abscessus]|nr:Uncharacterised protein [Mycobacteroides abscessus subsp. abscessus]